MFVPSYLDFVRVRNALTAHEVRVSRWRPSTRRRAIAARADALRGRARALLVTERAHFYHRRKIRGVNEVHFTPSRERAEFFAEFVQFANLRESASGSGRGGLVGASANRATVAFSRPDALRLERVVGTARAKKMLAKPTIVGVHGA